jgi:protein-disulfide isomerase
MNINRTITWGIFAVIIGLIIWGMIVSANKNSNQNGYIPEMDKVSETDWVKGNASSTITLVEYSDFQCPACAMYFSVVERLIGEYGDRIRFVFRNFPLTQHKNALPAAQSAGAAGLQGKFWEMYSMIFVTHSEWENSTSSKAVFRGYAQKLGLDLAKYDVDFDSDIVKDKISDDTRQAADAGVDSTPTFYLNGKKINSPRSYDEFKILIDEALLPKN